MLIADTIEVVKSSDKSRHVYITYVNGFGVRKKEMFRVVPSYSKAGVKIIVKHIESIDSDSYVVRGERIDEVRMSYREIIKRVGELMY
jgi:hypothetical protein